LNRDKKLQKSRGAEGTLKLNYKATVGTEALTWWGDVTTDMASLDDDCLVFDSEVITSPTTVIGIVQVHLKASSSMPLSHWIVRFEDVHPNGKVTLITGGLLNGAHRYSFYFSLTAKLFRIEN
jgi:predicted acyl esterase